MNMNNNRHSLVHISFDYPDSIVGQKTKAVSNLVNAQTSYDNVVFSLNRTANPFADFSVRKEPFGYSLKIFGLPFGIGLRIWMRWVAKKIYKIASEEGIQMSLVHAHKLTFEGIIAAYLYQQYQTPYILTVRGDTDLNLLRILRSNRPIYLNILRSAKHVIFLAPWTLNEIKRVYKNKLDLPNSKVLPNIIQLTKTSESDDVEQYDDTFVTVFHLDSYKRKNVERTIKALDSAHNKYPQLKLDIVGGGKSAEIIRSYISKCKYPSQFRLVGSLDHKEVLAAYSKYLGLILPSFPETFGLVFVEALHAGIPVLYSKNSGIDGYFDESQVSVNVNYKSIEEIAAGMIKIYEENGKYRERITLLKGQGGLDKFSKETISKQYINIVSPWLT
jgi:glycosyltransferase involved in cell wall biosynthesis